MVDGCVFGCIVVVVKMQAEKFSGHSEQTLFVKLFKSLWKHEAAWENAMILLVCKTLEVFSSFTYILGHRVETALIFRSRWSRWSRWCLFGFLVVLVVRRLCVKS